MKKLVAITMMAAGLAWGQSNPLIGQNGTQSVYGVKSFTNGNLRVNQQTTEPLAAVPYQQLTNYVGATFTTNTFVNTNTAAGVVATVGTQVRIGTNAPASNITLTNTGANAGIVNGSGAVWGIGTNPVSTFTGNGYTNALGIGTVGGLVVTQSVVNGLVSFFNWTYSPVLFTGSNTGLVDSTLWSLNPSNSVLQSAINSLPTSNAVVGIVNATNATIQTQLGGKAATNQNVSLFPNDAAYVSGSFVSNNFLVASGTNGSVSGIVTGINTIAYFGGTGRLTNTTSYTTNLVSATGTYAGMSVGTATFASFANVQTQTGGVNAVNSGTLNFLGGNGITRSITNNGGKADLLASINPAVVVTNGGFTIISGTTTGLVSNGGSVTIVSGSSMTTGSVWTISADVNDWAWGTGGSTVSNAIVPVYYFNRTAARTVRGLGWTSSSTNALQDRYAATLLHNLDDAIDWGSSTAMVIRIMASSTSALTNKFDFRITAPNGTQFSTNSITVTAADTEQGLVILTNNVGAFQVNGLTTNKWVVDADFYSWQSKTGTVLTIDVSKRVIK